MEKTNIEYFNGHLKSFINDIKNTFPEYENIITDYYGTLLDSETCNDDKYVKRFMRKTKEFKSDISKKNNDLFLNDIYILKNINFKDLWEHKELSDNNKSKIWEYIQTLFVLGETIISDSDKIKNLVKNFQSIRNPESEEATDTEQDKEMLEMLKNLSEKTKDANVDESLFTDGMIGKLAKELSEEINLDMNIDNAENVDDVFSNLISGDNPMKFMNLIQTVGKKIQNKVTSGELDQSKLVEEAQTMMGSLTGNNPILDNLMKAGDGNPLGEGGLDLADMATMATRMMGNRQPQPEPPSNPTRDRLKKKLEARKKK